MPQPYSAHNNYWWWGPPPWDTRVAIIVGWWSDAYAGRFFGSVERAGTIRNAFGVDNDEEGAPIWLASDARRSLPAMWPEMRSYG
ncbi:MAG TPA: hypothetical protein VIH70_11705 [Actinomycetota bacterium]